MKYKELIDQMTLEEKCSLLSGRDVWTTRPIERLGIPSIFLSDGPTGVRKQMGAGDHLGLNASVPATCLPTAATMANSWNPELSQQVGRLVGEEAASLDVNVLLGPGLNIKRSPLCGRNFEYFSEDPYLSGKMAAAFVRGVQENGISACPKHFAANSQELRRMANDSVMDERTFREIYLTGFEIAVKEGQPKTIMSAYNKINGVYANESKHLLQDVLVDDWGYQGAVVTDWGGSNDHVEGVRVGSHLEMPGTGGDSDQELVAAVKEGSLSMDLLDQRVDEFLRLVFSTINAPAAGKEFDKEGHHQLAAHAAEETVVLLKNEDDILPLAEGTKVAVIGEFAQKPRYQGAGSSLVNPTKLDTANELLAGMPLQSVGYAQGYQRNNKHDDALRMEAVELAKKADVVLLYVGLPEISETEGLDRDHMRMPENQVELLEAVAEVNPNLVVVLAAGSPVEMPWLDRCKALVHGYLGGQAGAGAVLRVIIGQVNPSAKLAESYPMTCEENPSSPYYPGLERTSEYREGLYVGYRYYETAGVPVRFPFGFGLSYTTFAYSDLKVSEKEVTFTLTNTGKRDGAEVAQLYVGCKDGKVFRPAKELKGFAKVFLKAGESKTVTIELDDKAFRYFDVKTDSWQVEGGVYQLMVGASVADIRLEGEVTVQGTGAACPYDPAQLECYYTGKITQVSDAQFEALLGHPIPESGWDASGLLGMNDAICQMYYAKNPLARLVYKILTSLKDKSIAKGEPDLNILFIYNMPFRGIAKMTGGAVTMDMARCMVTMVNGHFFKGLGGLIKAFFAGRKAQK